jgi:hypothetical protein
MEVEEDLFMLQEEKQPSTIVTSKITRLSLLEEELFMFLKEK